MKQGSLESIIEDMIRRLDGTQPGQENSSDPLQALEQFTSADPVLASLHKQYLEARAHHRQLAQSHGGRDPMTEVAMDMLDSARSAIQTRLIELQDMREEETRQIIRRRLLARQAEEELARAHVEMERRRRDKSSDLFFWNAVMVWLMQKTVVAANRKLSAAHDFALVSAGYGRRARYA